MRKKPLSSPLVPPLSFPSSAWECVPAKLCFALSFNPPDSGFTSPEWIRQAELGMTHSQAELGNDRSDKRRMRKND